MKVGVRFCGGCNPRYDRGAALRKLKEERKDVEFAIAEEGVDYDSIHCQFSTKEGVMKMWEENHIEDIKSHIDKIKK